MTHATTPQQTSRPTIAAVIPAYNAEKTIARTVDSVLAQTLPAREVFVVDDGSRDRTADIVRGFGERVTLVTQPNSGPNAARNHGIRLATSEWIALLDADDAWHADKLEKQAPFLTGDYDLVHSYVSNTSEAMKSTDPVTFDSLWKQNTLATSSVVVRKSAVEAVGGFIEDRTLIGAEDYNLWLRLAAWGMRSTCVPEVLVDYTSAENSLSSRYEKVLAGELENIERIRQVVNVSEDDVRQKQAALYDEYAGALLHARNLPAARRCFREGFRRYPRSRFALGWVATFVPTSVLNFKRRAMPQLADRTDT